jgi:hypothetical protein
VFRRLGCDTGKSTARFTGGAYRDAGTNWFVFSRGGDCGLSTAVTTGGLIHGAAGGKFRRGAGDFKGGDDSSSSVCRRAFFAVENPIHDASVDKAPEAGDDGCLRFPDGVIVDDDMAMMNIL